MNTEELKQSSLYRALKVNKKIQEVFEKIGNMKEWQEVKVFVYEYKHALLEEMFEMTNMDDIQRYKNQILGMERVVALPDAVKEIRELNRQEKDKQKEDEEDAKRRKYNPGALIRKYKNLIIKNKYG